ncbi:MAG: cobyrinic acid a,c-diamide synthase, partial [Gammaproteobacteria bacterium]|nr:cobyrinic acid a,c-diamide synthase [Gammaproteobacteria bacterium]
DIVMHERPQGRGYVRLRETANSPWPSSRPQGEFAAHEFHYSSLENTPDTLDYAYEVIRGTGIDGRNDGIVINNLLACYSHMRDTSQHHWAQRFVDFVRQIRT